MTLPKKVKTGDPLSYPAEFFNAQIDVVRDFQRRRLSTETATRGKSDIVKVKNSTGSDLSRNEIVELSDIVFGPSDNLDEFVENFAFVGSTPGTDLTRFAVTVEPIPAGEYGRALASGLVACKVDFASASDTSAQAKSGSTSELSSGSGPAQVLYKESGTGVKWAVVRFGGGGSGSDLALAQAPSGGIPARSGATPGSASCELLEVATSGGVGYSAGDLVKTGVSVTVKNWSYDIAAADGDRIVQISEPTNEAFVVGWSCNNTAAASVFVSA